MHVYTLVGLKNRMELLSIIKTLDYSFVSRIKRACIRSIGLELDYAFCACSRFIPGAISRKNKEKTRNSDLFKKVAKKMEEAGVLPM